MGDVIEKQWNFAAKKKKKEKKKPKKKKQSKINRILSKKKETTAFFYFINSVYMYLKFLSTVRYIDQVILEEGVTLREENWDHVFLLPIPLLFMKQWGK